MIFTQLSDKRGQGMAEVFHFIWPIRGLATYGDMEFTGFLLGLERSQLLLLNVV